MLSGLLRCAVCGGHYVIKSRKYYGCATNLNKGPVVCSNNRLVRRDTLEPTVMRLITDKLFSPEAIEYLTQRVKNLVTQPGTTRLDALRQDLARARQDLENIKSAIRQGLVTATTKAMLQEAEARVAHAEAAVREPDLRVPTANAVPGLVRKYLDDLHGLIGREPDRARTILQKLVGEVTLQPTDEGLDAVVRGNIPGILNLDKWYCTTGAGSPFLPLATPPSEDRVVA